MHDYKKGAELPSVMSLAFLGDAVYSLYIRRMLVARGISKSKDLNIAALSYVTAEAQAEHFQRISELLLDDEREVFRRAANSHSLNRPKHASLYEYRTATGFEAVLGMLEWIGDTERLEFLLDTAHKEDTENDTED